MKSEATIKRYRASWRNLSTFTKDKDARALTGDDVHAWAVDRRNREGVSPKSINQATSSRPRLCLSGLWDVSAKY